MPAHYHAGRSALEVRRILLTASGGPFLRKAIDALHDVTPDEAVAHPNWVMGRKISVDSATMMNKGLELIEACLLFHTPPEKVEVVIHPQSVIHSMVDYVDGTVLAQMGNPDMRIPIAHAMAWPERFDSGAEPLDLFKIQRLDFEAPDFERFPCLQRAYDAVTVGETMPAILNAANEVAVGSFLEGGIRFTAIPDVIKHCMESVAVMRAHDIPEVLEADRQSREAAAAYIGRLQS